MRRPIAAPMCLFSQINSWSFSGGNPSKTSKGITEIPFSERFYPTSTPASLSPPKHVNQSFRCRIAPTTIRSGNSRWRFVKVFYQSALDGQWQFSEALPYLRQLGALDESKQGAPAVIIPNYLNGPSNCVASSKFYAVCCIDECEPLLGHVEQSVAAPDASPEFIAELVSNLPSATVSAPRELPKARAAHTYGPNQEGNPFRQVRELVSPWNPWLPCQDAQHRPGLTWAMNEKVPRKCSQASPAS